MTKPVRLDAEAESELLAAVAWYEQQREGLGSRFLAAIDEAVERLRERPLAGSPVPGVDAAPGVRRFLLRRFPYSVVFLELPGEIRVLAIAHARRRPAYWQGR